MMSTQDCDGEYNDDCDYEEEMPDMRVTLKAALVEITMIRHLITELLHSVARSNMQTEKVVELVNGQLCGRIEALEERILASHSAVEAEDTDDEDCDTVVFVEESEAESEESSEESSESESASGAEEGEEEVECDGNSYKETDEDVAISDVEDKDTTGDAAETIQATYADVQCEYVCDGECDTVEIADGSDIKVENAPAEVLPVEKTEEPIVADPPVEEGAAAKFRAWLARILPIAPEKYEPEDPRVLSALVAMGFSDEEANRKAMQRYKGAVAKVIDTLLGEAVL